MSIDADPTNRPGTISDRDLVLNFESLGDNCELGLVQRLVGAEPLGLLRFASAPAGRLLPALNARFEGLADPANVEVIVAKGEYMIALRKYDLLYHAHAKVGETDPETLSHQQARTLPFLVNKLIGDLENPEKIFVFRQNEPLAANTLIDLRAALARFGAVPLLWVQQERPGHPAGTADRIDDTLMAGYVRRLASRENVPDLDLGSWLATLRRAYDLWRALPAPATAAFEIVFGETGNAGAFTGFGWSRPNTDHTWTIDDRSQLTFAPPGDAEHYRLDMDVRPFTSPPSLTAQHLDVIVNATMVRRFDPLQPGIATCIVPGHLIRGHDSVEILLEHPNAARPSDLGISGDSRRLAVMFHQLTLTGLPDQPAGAPMPTRVEVLFGAGERTPLRTEYGWSPPEAGFTWAIDDRSLLSLAPLAAAANYWLEIDAMPFTVPPALPAQWLEILVNGEFVRSFDPLPDGISGCLIPGRLIGGRDHIDILLAHPRAARPIDLDAGPDERRLAILFRKVTLAGVAG